MMPGPPPPPSTPGGEPPPLPVLHEALLRTEDALRVLDDIAHTATLIAAIPKAGPRERAPEGTLGLEEARRLVAEEVVRGLQLRYRHDGVEWWDTFIRAPGGWRIVRLRHEFGRLPSP